MTAYTFASPSEPSFEGISADTGLIAELALTFDLDALVTESEIDPFRR